jgi:subfamily B ATP-binding cassette protein HlyB/CyaB
MQLRLPRRHEGGAMVKQVSKDAFYWILQRLCAMHRKPLPLEPLHAAPFYSPEAMMRIAKLFGFDTTSRMCKACRLHRQSFPLIAWLRSRQDPRGRESLAPVLLLQADAHHVLILAQGDAVPNTVPLVEFARRFSGAITSIRLADAPAEPACNQGTREAA